MNKFLPLPSFLRTSRAKGTLQSLSAVLLLGCGVVNVQAQSPVASEKVTSNLHERVKLLRTVNGGTLNLFLAPELPSHVEREHWPIVFLSKVNSDGEEVQVMKNLVQPEMFAVDVASAKNAASVAGEDGLWTVDAQKGSVSSFVLTTPSLRYLQLSYNELKTDDAAAAGVLALPAGLNNLERLDVAYNKLNSLDLTQVAGSLRSLNASGNMLASADYSMLAKMTDMNLQGNRLATVKVPATFVDNVKIFDVSSTSGVSVADYATAYDANLKSNALDKLMVDHKAQLDLSVNRLKISTLPRVPNGIDVSEINADGSGKYEPKSRFNYAAQERLELPKSAAGNNKYQLNEGINLSSEMNALAQDGSSKTTKVTWYVEKQKNTDLYTKIDPADYEVVGGVTKFKRGFGRDVKIFAALENEAFDYKIKSAAHGAVQAPGLTSFEATTAATDPLKGGYGFVTAREGGKPVAEMGYTDAGVKEADKVGRLKTTADYAGALVSDVEDGLAYKGDVHNSRGRGLYRSDVILLKGNYWYGFKDNDWAKAENWTMRYVPETTPAQYAALADKSEADVEFATSDPAQYGSDAIRDLHTDADRVIEKYINKSTTKKALVVQASHKLNIKNAVEVTKDGGKDLPELLRVKAGDDTTPNGSLYVDSKVPVNATVELYAKSSNQGSGLQRANWQYFGAPVAGAYNTKKNVFGSALVRKYDRTLAIANSDEKWVALNDADVVEPGAGYEVATPTPTRFEFKGALKYGNTKISGEDAFEFDLDGAATGTNYNDINILANPFTSAMNIGKIQKNKNAGNVVGTVYLFNAGSRENWLAKNGATTPGNDAGQYTQAIPIGLTGALPGQVTEIPSLSSFAVKANGSASIYYRYADLVKTETANRARRMDVSAPRVASITVDVASEKSMDRLWLVEHEDATEGFDNDFDGEKMLTAGAAQLYAEGAQNLQVKTTSRLDQTDLSFIPADKAERYELKFHLNGFNAGDEFVLLDKRTGAETKINDGDKYSFIADRNDKRQRFAILRKGTSLNSVTKPAFAVVADGARNIEVINETSEAGNVMVVDAAGKSIARFTLAAGARKSVQVAVAGVYVVKAENAQSRLSQSVLVH